MRRITICATLAAFMLPAGSALASPLRMSVPKDDQIPAKRLFDIGVADPDGDGWLDIFTTNHKFASVFLRNHGGHRFSNEIEEIGLGPDLQFPGLELLKPPPMDDPGVYIWPTDAAGEAGRLHIATSGITASGRVELLTRNVKVRSQDGAEATLGRYADDRPYVEFTVHPGGALVLASNGLSDLPIRFAFDQTGSGAVQPDQVGVGTRGIHPQASTFSFMLRDRHGIAFADVAGDPDQDAFVATGGLGGGIASERYLGRVEDMFLVSGAGPDGGYGNLAAVSGIAKSYCRGRAVSYADPDGDGRLDLLTTCEGAPARVWALVLPGGFVRLPGPPVIATTYRWAQIDRGHPALLMTTPRGLEVWRSVDATWFRTQRVGVGANAGQISVGDFDNSGTLDVLLAGRGQKLRLLRNVRGKLRPVKGNLGLPEKAVAGAFVDVDNDGRQEVSLAPQGLYRWSRTRHRFVATGRMRTRRSGYAIVQWADFDNDGRRDPLIATSKREFSPRSKVVRRRNTTRSGHWLEVVLRGAEFNREAIGASVRVDPARGGRRITQWVGQNDDSRHSQGHYRLYFGLGKARAARRLVVRWPDGRKTRLRGVEGDRVLRIGHRRR